MASFRQPTQPLTAHRKLRASTSFLHLFEKGIDQFRSRRWFCIHSNLFSKKLDLDKSFWQVRRKADPAKSLVKDWVKNWRDSPAISREVSYREISGRLPFWHVELQWYMYRHESLCPSSLPHPWLGIPSLFFASCSLSEAQNYVW